MGFYEKLLEEKDLGGLLEEAKANEENDFQEKKASISGFDLSNYIYVPEHNITIATKQELTGEKVEDIHRTLIKQGRRMPKVNEFMQHFINVRDAAYQKKELYDGCKNKIDYKRIKEIYTDLTTKTTVWLNANFYDGKFYNGEGEGSLDLEIVTGLEPNGELEIKRVPLKKCLREKGVFVELDLNSQGFPKEKVKISHYRYTNNHNIMYVSPNYKGRVFFGKWIQKFRGGFLEPLFLSCDRGSDNWKDQQCHEKIGVLPCIDL